MLNQKGQQFSVFELMIAGIVAFAILMLLLTIIGKIDIGQAQQAQSVIQSGISSALPSATVTTKNFIMQSGDNLTASDLTNKTGLDASRIFFVKGQLGDAVTVDAGEGAAGGSSVSNAKSSSLTARAKIICKATADEVAASITRLGSGYVSEGFNSSTDCPQDNQSCCAVVLEKPGN